MVLFLFFLQNVWKTINKSFEAEAYVFKDGFLINFWIPQSEGPRPGQPRGVQLLLPAGPPLRRLHPGGGLRPHLPECGADLRALLLHLLPGLLRVRRHRGGRGGAGAGGEANWETGATRPCSFLENLPFLEGLLWIFERNQLEQQSWPQAPLWVFCWFFFTFFAHFALNPSGSTVGLEVLILEKNLPYTPWYVLQRKRNKN